MNYRDQFVRSKVLGKPTMSNPSFARGHAVEYGICEWLCRGLDENDAVQAAIGHYALKSADLPPADKVKFKDQIDPMVRAGIRHYKEVNAISPSGDVLDQVKIETYIDATPTKIIGYIDLLYPNKVRDIKTASRTPSALSDGYKIQGAVYKLATGKDVIFDFIVPLKTGVKVKSIQLSPDDFNLGMKLINVTVKSMDAFFAGIPEEDDRTAKDLDFINSLALPALGNVWNPAERIEILKSFS